nr:immunoglobulin heavy chain junction region [Macaca mulatta]MOW32826.1 immunoglobulin heavy chain junction region [Macaca mulatta]MOW33024.1 immunoglobulin heavy chain junction region [Macaca mulatta]MOW33032.1 immunoglobulin heavy chain junction region [Macaca mulatta]MOW33215.1 immunoglobulin heavy chain junction region [Macaca mulatta]
CARRGGSWNLDFDYW